MTNDFEKFHKERLINIKSLNYEEQKSSKGKIFSEQLFKHKYTYNFNWLGIPIIQMPQDIVVIQEIIWDTRPDMIIETGVARGGSLIFYASMCKLLNNNARVIGIDIDIRPHNRQAIKNHSLSQYIELIQGSSIEVATVNKVKKHIKPDHEVMVVLDSNHTHEHVLKELKLYAPLVSKGCYLVVLDTIIEDIPDALSKDRQWGKGNNPKTAIHEFLIASDRFSVDAQVHQKLGITCAPEGYLKCLK